MQLFAEVKPESPFDTDETIRQSWDELFAIACEVGDFVAVHTEAPWGGSIDLLRKARILTDKPILAKGIHANDEQIEEAIEYGADLVLVVGRIASVHAGQCLVEPNNIEELKELPVDTMAIWNSRDLETGGLKPQGFDVARQHFDGWLCQASNIATLADIHPEADAALFGTHLPEIARELQANPVN